MYIINGTTSDADQGSNIQGAPSTAPPVAPVAQSATTVGERKGANKRAHDTMVTPGRNVQTDNNNQSSDAATNMANSSAILSVVPTASTRRGTRDVAASASQSSLSIPIAQATTFTAQAVVLADEALDPRIARGADCGPDRGQRFAQLQGHGFQGLQETLWIVHEALDAGIARGADCGPDRGQRLAQLQGHGFQGLQEKPRIVHEALDARIT